jgi:hypothetical protein
MRIKFRRRVLKPALQRRRRRGIRHGCPLPWRGAGGTGVGGGVLCIKHAFSRPAAFGRLRPPRRLRPPSAAVAAFGGRLRRPPPPDPAFCYPDFRAETPFYAAWDTCATSCHGQPLACRRGCGVQNGRSLHTWRIM